MSFLLFFRGPPVITPPLPELDPRFTGDLEFVPQQSLSPTSNRINLNAQLNFETDPSGQHVTNCYFPKDGHIVSGPLFVHAIDFPSSALEPGFELDATNVVPITDTEIEFRTFNEENSKEQTWKSTGDSPSVYSSNEIIIDDGTSTAEWCSNDENLSITGVGDDGINISSSGPLTNNNMVYRTYDEVSVPSGAYNARYITFEVISDRKGMYLELQAHHGLSFNSSESFGSAPNPFRKRFQIDRVNDKQTIIWDIGNWPSSTQNEDYLRALVIKVIDANDDFNLSFKNFRFFKIDDTGASKPSHAPIPDDPERFVQYRVTLSTTDKSDVANTPTVNEVKLRFEHGNAIFPSRLMRGQKYFLNGEQSFPERRGSKILY